MGKHISILILLSFIVLVDSLAHSWAINIVSHELNRNDFPKGFVFGTASSAYQVEGAAKEGGKGASIWDTFSHNSSTMIADGTTGDVALDFYHRYKEDVKILKEMGMNGLRFSISWPRLLPNGSLSGGVNKQGIDYYNNLINELLSNGIEPFVTIFHWDLPQALEDEYNGFLSPRIVNDFKDFAELCFKEFGDRVKHWITMNEPWIFNYFGYTTGFMAPGRCSGRCQKGDSTKEPYVVGHNLILSHAAAVKVYRDKYQATQKGKIGITLNTDWIIPHSDSKADKDATQRAFDFTYGWFLNPLVYGSYPSSMRSLVKDRLPEFTQDQSNMVKGAFDFLGLNYYGASYAVDVPASNKQSVSGAFSIADSLVNYTWERDGVLIGPKAGAFWQHVYPEGIKDLLLYIKNQYNNPVIYITENGFSEKKDDQLSIFEVLLDKKRIDYYRSHLLNVQQAIKEGVDVRGYFAWTLIDNYEWGSGYTIRFGLYHVDRQNGLKRYPKASARWFRNFLQTQKTTTS